MNLRQLFGVILSWIKTYVYFLAWKMATRPPASAQHMKVDDIEIYFRVFGQGDPVLLMHGGFMSWESWAGQIPQLSRYFQVIAMDLRGHGRTTLGDAPLDYRRMARDAAALLESLGKPPTHVVGWSDGGCTGVALALERSDLVRSLTLIGTPLNTRDYSEDTWRRIERLLRPWSIAQIGLRLLRRLINPEPTRGKVFLQRMAKMWRELPNFTPEEMAKMEIPVLVLACDRDEFLSPKNDPLIVFRSAVEVIPRAWIYPFPGGKHHVHMEYPHKVNSIIMDFLKMTSQPNK